MKIPFSPPDITEAEANEVRDALLSGWITTGPRTKELERQIATFCQTKRAVCLNSATACLESILRILGIGPGDEVITSAYTYTASASVVCHVGAKLVLVDTQQDGYEMDYAQLADAITERTKAIIPVDLGGIPCDYQRILNSRGQEIPFSSSQQTSGSYRPYRHYRRCSPCLWGGMARKANWQCCRFHIFQFPCSEKLHHSRGWRFDLERHFRHRQ